MNKKCLIFAHRMEASYFLTKNNWKLLEPNIFEMDGNILIITGQGKKNVSFMLNKFKGILYNRFKIDQFINMGVAGSNTPYLSCGSICSVRQVKRIDSTIVYLSADDEAVYDCLSCDQPMDVKNLSLSETYCFDVVDMELWTVACFAHDLNVPFYGLKYITDFVSEKLNKGAIQAQAETASYQLWKAYKNIRIQDDLV